MAHIVQFRIGVAREVEAAEPRQGGGAQVVIFPGVRREHHGEPAPRPPVKGPQERDFLKLPD